MKDLTREQQHGCARAYFKASGQFTTLAPEYWDDLKAKWMRGEAFIVGKDLWGDEVIIRLGDVTAIARVSPEGILRYEEDERIADSQDKQKDITG